MLTGLAIALLVFVVYGRALNNRFVWQDVATIERAVTPTIDSLSSKQWVCPAPAKASSRLPWSILGIEHRLWGLDPRGYHLVSVISHAISALLFWRLLLLFALPGAGLAAMLFAVHPLCVESVAWVAATDTVVSGTMCLATMLAYFKSAADNADPSLTRRSDLLYALSVGLYVLALFSDPISVALPAVLLVLQWWKYGHLTRRMFAVAVPFAMLALLAMLVQVTASRGGEQPSVSMDGASIVSAALMVGRSFWFYAGKVLWPHPLIFIYPRWDIAPSQWWQYVPLAGVLALLGGLWWLRGRIGRGPYAAAIIFAIALLPRSLAGVTSRLADTFVADHLAYHAALALVALATAVAMLAIRRLAQGKTLTPAVASIAVIASLALLAERRSHVFHDRVTLDKDTLSRSPDAWMAHHDLAAIQRENGDIDDAIQSERHAIEILDGRWRANRANGDCADNLAGCYGQLAVLLEQFGKSTEASAARDQAVEVHEELVRQDPDVPAYHDHLAWDYVLRAYAERDRGKPIDALDWFQKAVAEQEIVVYSYPARYSTQKNLATNYVDIGIIELDQNLGLEAQASFARARDLRERLVDAFPSEPKYRDDLAWCYIDLGLVESWLAKPESALRVLSNAVAQREQLVREHPEVAEYQERLAVLYSDMGLKSRQLEDFAEAERAFQSAQDLRRRLAREYPHVEEYQDNLAANYVDIGSIQHARGQLAAAERSCREAIAIRLQLALRQPKSGIYAQRLAASYVELSILLREADRVAESLAACQLALAICQKMNRNAPDSANYQAALSWAYENLGLTQIADRQAAAAVVACRTAVRMSEVLVRKSGEAIGPRIDLARALTNLAKAQFANNQLAEAEESHRKAIEERAQLTQDAPGVDEYKHLTAVSCHDLADVLRSSGRPQGAAALYQAAIETHEALVAQKNSKTYRSSLKDDLLAHAEVSAEMGDWSTSAAGYAKAREYDNTVENVAARALLQLAEGDEAGYRETCTALVRQFGNDVSPKSSFVVALALVVGKCDVQDAKAAGNIARRDAAAPAHSGADILVATSQYRAGMVDEAIAGLQKSLATLNADEDARDRSLVVRLIGTMLLADAYRQQHDAAALDAELMRLDELIIESLVVGSPPQDDGLPSWSVRLAVEIARRELASLRDAPSAQSKSAGADEPADARP